MARRQILDTGVGINALTAISGGVQERIKARQDEEAKLRQLLADAHFKEQAANQYDPQRIAETRQLALIDTLKGTPTPGGSGYTEQERSLGLPAQVEEAARQRNAPVMEQLQMLKGLGRRSSGNMDGIAYTIVDGQAVPLMTPEGANVPTSSNRIVTSRMSPEEAGQREEEKRKAAHIAALEIDIRNLDRLDAGIDALFKEGNEKVPPVQGVGELPIASSVAGTMRKAGLAMGANQEAKGFIDTYPIEARQQLADLEPGGRYTNIDVEQIMQASTPRYDETATSRTSKVQELKRKYAQQRDEKLQQLQALKGGQPMTGAPDADNDPLGIR